MLQDRDKIFIFQEDMIIFIFTKKIIMINNIFLTAFHEKHPAISVHRRMHTNFTFSH